MKSNKLSKKTKAAWTRLQLLSSPDIDPEYKKAMRLLFKSNPHFQKF